MRYSNAGYIGTGVYPNEYGDVDGVWRYFTDVVRAIGDYNWYVSSIPQNIVVAPSAIIGATGDIIDLSCTYDEDISGFEEIFSWQKSNNQILWTDISGANNNEYSFTAGSSDSGTYLRCKVFRGLKNGTSNIVPVSIALGKINITSQPSNTTVYAAETATFYITANTTIGTLAYEWQESSDSGISWNTAPGIYSNSSYSFLAEYAKNSYRYRCYLTASGAVSKYSNTVTLTVNNNTITFDTQPSNQTCGIYSSYNTFTVSATTTNNKTPSYQWYKADNSPSYNNWMAISAEDNSYTGRLTNQLTADCDLSTTHLKCLAIYNNISGYSDFAIHYPYSI